MIAAKQQLLVNDEPYPFGETLVQREPNSNIAQLQTLLPSRQILHTPKSGLNPIVDSAGHFISVLGNLKTFKKAEQARRAANDLFEELKVWQARIQSLGYANEFILVSRYILCATFDDIAATLTCCTDSPPSLLQAYKLDLDHEQKFFDILERAIREPVFYIDLMELMYICLSLGYQGKYRSKEQGTFELEQITDTLYKHVRAYRGSISKMLSPTPLRVSKIPVKTSPSASQTLAKTFAGSACMLMFIFISLGYLMDTLLNEAYNDITQVEKHLISYATKQ